MRTLRYASCAASRLTPRPVRVGRQDGGVSSGAVLHGALRLARRIRSGAIVALLADSGWKYLSSGIWTQPLPEAKRTMEGKIWW